MKKYLLLSVLVISALIGFSQNDFSLTINLDKVKGECRTGDCKGAKGKKTFENGYWYQGFWFKKKMHGKGELYLGDHPTIHKLEGTFSEGILSGKVTIHLKDNSDIIAEFDNNSFVKATKKLYQNKASYFQGDFNGLIPVKGNKVVAINKWEGNFQNEELEGTGKLYKNNVLFYEGNFVAGKRVGKGKELLEDGSVYYDGEWKDNKMEGAGTMFSGSGVIYNGAFNNGVFDGKGISFYDDGTKKYEGSFLKGEESGKGISYSETGATVYNGNWIEGSYNGTGTEYYENGNTKYVGDFKAGFYYGQGKSYHENGKLAYNGEWENGQFNNYGKSFFDNGKLAYEGGFYLAVKQGYGKDYNTEGQLMYQGYMNNNAMDGYGVHYTRDGLVDYEGVWDNGALTTLDATKIDPVYNTEYKKTCKTMVLLKDTLFTTIDRTEKFTGECISEHASFNAMNWYANGKLVKELYYESEQLKVKILHAPEGLITRYEFSDDGKVTIQVDFKETEKLVYTERTYHANGLLASDYTQNEDGTFTKNEYHSNGTKKVAFIFNADFTIKDGVYQQLDSLGNTSIIETYQNGSVINSESMK